MKALLNAPLLVDLRNIYPDDEAECAVFELVGCGKGWRRRPWAYRHVRYVRGSFSKLTR